MEVSKKTIVVTGAGRGIGRAIALQLAQLGADIALFDLRHAGYSGAGDALSALLLCAPTRVDTLIIDGRVVVESGELRTLGLDRILRRHRRVSVRFR